MNVTIQIRDGHNANLKPVIEGICQQGNLRREGKFLRTEFNQCVGLIDDGLVTVYLDRMHPARRRAIAASLFGELKEGDLIT